MQLTISPENPLEWLALRLNLAPIPLLHAQIMPVLAKAVLEAADKGVFEGAKDGPKTLDELVAILGLNSKALNELLGLLTAMGYFTYKNNRFALTRMARRFALKDDPLSVHGMMVFNNRVVWDWLNHLAVISKRARVFNIMTRYRPSSGNIIRKRWLPPVAPKRGNLVGGHRFRSQSGPARPYRCWILEDRTDSTRRLCVKKYRPSRLSF